jgi:hypothetical protein
VFFFDPNPENLAAPLGSPGRLMQHVLEVLFRSGFYPEGIKTAHEHLITPAGNVSQ